MSISFNTTYYLQNNPDVLQAIAQGVMPSAEFHFNEFGWKENRAPNATFDVEFYLINNPDVLAAGVNPLTHFIEFGAAEGGTRKPNANFVSSANFDTDAYAAANPDLAAAGLTTAAQLYAHFAVYGFAESRPGVQALDGTTIGGIVADNAGITFALTSAADNVQGTAQDNIINGSLTDEVESTTLTAGDVINGGGGMNTLRILVTDDQFDDDAIVTLNNVQRVEIQDFDGADLNAVNWTGVQTIAIVDGNDYEYTEIENLQNIVDLELSDTNNDVTLDYRNTVVAGTDDVQNIAIDGAGYSDVYVYGVETFNVSVTGAFEDTETNDVDFNGDLETLNISGDGNLVTDVDNSVRTFDASTATGNITADLDYTADVTVTGGLGDDKFTFDSTLTKADVVDGGEGFDTVSVSAGDYSLATSAILMGMNALTSIERVEFTGGTNLILNGSTFKNDDVTHFLFNGSDSDTVNNAVSARTYQFGDNNSGAATFNMQAGSTTLDVELLGTQGLEAVSKDGRDADVGNITINLSGTEAPATVATINLTSSGDLRTFDLANAATYNDVGVIAAKAGSTINIDGEASLNVAGLENRATVNASELTGNLVIEGSEATGAIVTAAAESGADTITLGQGLNRVEFNSGLDSGVDNNTTGAAAGSVFVDNIIGFTAGSGGDVLDWTPGVDTKVYTALAATAQTAIDALAGAGATLEAALNIAADANGAAGWSAFSFQGQTYAIYEGAADAGAFDYATDLAVQITGVAVADLTADNFA